jgi:hypothetical protein
MGAKRGWMDGRMLRLTIWHVRVVSKVALAGGVEGKVGADYDARARCC